MKEVEAHIKDNHWELVKWSEVPPGMDVLPSIWAVHRKWNLMTNKIKGTKARLNIHGGKQVYGRNYYRTYAHIVTWFAIWFMITLAIMLTWSMRQIDFVQAYTQAPIKHDMYMELPQGIETKHGNSKDYVLKLLANLYGQKQAGHVWNQYMAKKLCEVGFMQSIVNECVFYQDDVIFIVYVDGRMFLAMVMTQSQILLNKWRTKD